jgi:starch phosphorylase
LLNENNFEKAKEIAKWKETVAADWDKFEVLKVEYNPNQTVGFNNSDEEIYGRAVIDKKDLICDLGVECVIVSHDTLNNEAQFVEAYPFDLVKTEGSLLYFEVRETPSNPGTHQYGIRVFPKNADLPHRMDFAYVRWI